MGIGYYLSLIDFAVQEKVLPMIHYIEKKYPTAVFGVIIKLCGMEKRGS